MTLPPGPISPHHVGAPSRVIQGYFPGGRPNLIQKSSLLAAPVRPHAHAPAPAPPVSPPALFLPGRPAPVALQPALRPGQPPRPILPTNARPAAIQPATPVRPPVPQPRPILPRLATPTAVQPQAADAFALPANFTLKPRGSGQVLPEPIQKKMESFFNTSFADVRVHVGTEAASIGALAFTHGTDLYFAPGQYNPQSTHGQQLLGHELTHVVQQRAGRVRNPLGSGVAVVQDPALEAEAERMGLRASMASVPVQAKLATIPPASAPLPGKIIGTTVIASNGAILPPPAPAPGSLQRKPAPVLAGMRSILESKSPGSVSPIQRRLGFVRAGTTDKDRAEDIELIFAEIDKIRKSESEAKKQLESNLTKALEPLISKVPISHGMNDPNLRQRSTLIKEHALALDTIGLSIKKIKENVEFRKLLQSRGLQIKGNRIVYSELGESDITLVKLFEGDDAMEDEPFLKKDSVAGICRDVYRKKGRPVARTNEFVKDDVGNFVRRYAYVEKSKYQFRELLATGAMRGRFSTDVEYKDPRHYTAITNETRDTVPKLPNVNNFTDPYQLAYVHQELGSGPEQRGISASSTVKYTIFSNQGLPFKSSDGIFIEVDLARINPGKANKPKIIDHYSPTAREKIQKNLAGYYIEKGNHQRDLDHYLWSTRKNREIFINKVKPEHISSITFHQTVDGVSQKENSASTFKLTDLQGFGARYVAITEYKDGFVAGRDAKPRKSVWPNTTADQSKKRYYDDGFNDGAQYNRGYQDGLYCLSGFRDGSDHNTYTRGFNDCNTVMTPLEYKKFQVGKAHTVPTNLRADYQNNIPYRDGMNDCKDGYPVSPRYTKRPNWANGSYDSGYAGGTKGGSPGLSDKKAKELSDDTKTRERQGIWDAIHGRPKRDT